MVVNRNKQCSVEGCGSSVLAKDLCGKHYDRMRRLGTTDLKVKTSEQMCSACNERLATYRSGTGPLCHRCYRRSRRTGIVLTPFVCAHCGKPFESRYNKSARVRYCSRSCKEAGRVADGRAAESGLKWHYKARYGLTLEQVSEMRSKGCGICGSDGRDGRWGNLHIDHDHVTGRVRGALCYSCNLGIGNFKESPGLLKAAIRYLR